jgi:hypothetical protein
MSKWHGGKGSSRRPSSLSPDEYGDAFDKIFNKAPKMNPTRQTTINGHHIQQFYSEGEFTTYVDNKIHWGTYADAVEECSKA